MAIPIRVSDLQDASLDKITTKELAEQLGTDKKVLIENARKYLPGKVFSHGKLCADFFDFVINNTEIQIDWSLLR